MILLVLSEQKQQLKVKAYTLCRQNVNFINKIYV